ncbi:hypothetical protein EJB05_10654, partial [Eragrostis curvula]
MAQYSSSWPHQGHRLWAAMPLAFWVYFYKVRRCPISSAHDWKECPYWHPWERVRRRDPRTHPYLSEYCPDYLASDEYHRTRRTGKMPTCVRGRTCPYAHGVFELWLHQDRFRTRMCAGGHKCGRTICFFAHFSWQQRCPGDMVPYIDIQQLVPSWLLRAPPRSLLPPPPPLAVLPAHAPAPPPQRDIHNMIDEASASSFSWSSSSAGSSSSSPPGVVVAAVATTSTAIGYPTDNGMSDDQDSELGEFPYFDIIRDFLLG